MFRFPGSIITDTDKSLTSKELRPPLRTRGIQEKPKIQRGNATFPAELCSISKSNFRLFAKLKIIAYVPQVTKQEINTSDNPKALWLKE